MATKMKRSFIFIACLVLVFANFLLSGLTLSVSGASLPLHQSSAAQSSVGGSDVAVWWNASWHYRTYYAIYSGDRYRIDVPIQISMNFTAILETEGVQASFDENSVRVIEYNLAGEILHEAPSQFDKVANYHVNFNAVGSVAWIMEGTTLAGTTRNYYVYFDTVENGLKDPPNYAGVSVEASGNYVSLQNQKIRATIRYKMNGTYISELYLDRNVDGIFDPAEEMIGSEYPYHLKVIVTKTEQDKHGWAFPYFETIREPEANFTILKNGPVLKEIAFSDVKLRNKVGEALNVSVTLILKLFNMSSTFYMKTLLKANEDVEVSDAYEEDFLDHRDLYDKWYIDEVFNGVFTYKTDQWFFVGSPSHGYVCSYSSLGNGGVAFIPNVGQYSRIFLGEFQSLGPWTRFFISAGTWQAGKQIEMENRLFVHLGDWSNVLQEAHDINNPPVVINRLSIRLVDSNNRDLINAEVRVYDSLGDLVGLNHTDSTGWTTFVLNVGEYTIKPFWMGFQVASTTISVSGDIAINSLKCDVYELAVSALPSREKTTGELSFGLYLLNGTRIASSETSSNDGVYFTQLPKGDYIIKAFSGGRYFGASPIQLVRNLGLTISEEQGLDPPRPIRNDLFYALMVFGSALMAIVLMLKKGFEKIKLGLLCSILVLTVFLAAACMTSSPFLTNTVEGISNAYDSSTGLVSVGDVMRVEWKDGDKDGKLDDWNLLLTTSNRTEIAKIDLRMSLATPVGAYKLYEADVRDVYYFDTAVNDYSLWKPLLHEPDFSNSPDFRRSLKLKLNFSKPGQWETSLFVFLEEGKPYVQLNWEIVEKGEGAGQYSLYPQIIPIVKLRRLILPTQDENILQYWNQKGGLRFGNPWTSEAGLTAPTGYVGSMYINSENIVLHSSKDYSGVQVTNRASSAFARKSSWVNDQASNPPYFQYDFWIDWDGKTSPSSDIKIEVWVPDTLDLNRTEIFYNADGATWTRYDKWTLIEGNTGDYGFSPFAGCRHRLVVTFPASNFKAENGEDTGKDYGDPLIGNDEYLVRLKVAYINDGLTTYEFENSSNLWFGVRNINDVWMWLMDSERSLGSLGIVTSKQIEHLSVQANQREIYNTVTMGVRESLNSNGKASFYTNLVMFSADEQSRGDQDSDGISDMFDEDLLRFLPSALHFSRESLGQITFDKKEYSGADQYFYLGFDKTPIANDWNKSAQYAVCLTKTISRKLESDDAFFLFEQTEYYVYDVSQSNEIRWEEKSVDIQNTYQLYAIAGLAAISMILGVKSWEAVKKYRVILILFFAGLTIRLYFQNLSVYFVGSDGAMYANAAQNFVDYGKFEVNILGLEPIWIRVGSFPVHITLPFGSVERLLYPFLIAVSFMILGVSFFAIKAVDVVLGSLVILPTFYLAKKLFDEKTAIVATLITLFNPLLIYYSGVHPSISILPALWGTAALCSMVYESKKAAFAAAIFTILLLFSRLEYAVFVVGVFLFYYLFMFGRHFWRKASLYVFFSFFIIVFASASLGIYLFEGRFPFAYSTKQLGGTMGELRSPTLLETLSDPNFMQIRIYNALYGWWYVFYQYSPPLIFFTAIVGLLINIKNWRKLSPLFLFPFLSVAVFSVAIRAPPTSRFIVQSIPLLSALSAAFILKVSESASLPRLDQTITVEVSHLKRLLLVFVFIEIILLSYFPHYVAINTATQKYSWKFSNDNILYHWIDVNVAPNSVVMVPDLMYVFFGRRELVRLPMPRPNVPVDLQMVISVIKQYRVDYVVIDRHANYVPDLAKFRRQPANAPYGFNLVYCVEDPNAYDPYVYVYDVRGLHD